MSRIIFRPKPGIKVPIIEAEPDQECESCHEDAETRPYGPGGIEVCYNCFEKHPEWEDERKRRCLAFLDGKPEPRTVPDWRPLR